MKPILFNTEMVRAIISGRKTCTRRLIKGLPLCGPHATVDEDRLFIEDEYGDFHPAEAYSSIQRGDILYVRETWKQAAEGDSEQFNRYLYRADEPIDTSGMRAENRWHPSLHMPKKAARIFLEVTDVRAERLHDMTDEQAVKEGCEGLPCSCQITGRGYHGCTDCMNTGWLEPPLLDFMYLWDSTVKKKDIPVYGWNADPWVWVIDFRKLTDEEANEHLTAIPDKRGAQAGGD